MTVIEPVERSQMTAPPFHIGFEPERLTSEDLDTLREMRRQCAHDIVAMTTLAACGHPGGSLSSLDCLLVAYATLAHRPGDPLWSHRDRVIVSHGHISPGVYSVLAANGYFDRDEAVAGFRMVGSPYGGHVESHVPGVEWNTGNLGQGLSAGCASALAARLRGESWKTVVFMGDGEQQKGQVSEARRFARKFGLDNLIAIIDLNLVQIGGRTCDIMPQDIAAEYTADGWHAVEIDGHDPAAIYSALRSAYAREDGQPTALLARTRMGHGISFMEAADHGFHGKAASRAEYALALQELGLPDRMGEFEALRAARERVHHGHTTPEFARPAIEVGPAVTLAADAVTDCRSAYGKVLKDLAERNNPPGSVPRVLGISCDLEGSVKMDAFHAISPQAFIETGIMEHHAAVLAGRLSREGFLTFYSTFGVFAVTEGYNQQRLNDYNGACPKVVATHCGLDVGEDGPTHQVIDYVGLLSNLFGFEIFVPGDPNQCDRIVRHVATSPAPQFVGMGRSKMPPLLDESGAPFYGESRPEFVPGRADVLREGDDGAILACGPVVHAAVGAHDLILAQSGRRVRVVNMASLKPLDAAAVLAAADTGVVLTAEDHHPDTGLGSLVACTLADAGRSARFGRAGVDRYGASGKPADLYAAFGLDAAGLARRWQELAEQ